MKIIPPTSNSAATQSPPAQTDLAAYLFVYFTDATHSVHMALSSDGYTFTALNDASP
jgi:hypothetical protein